MIVRETSEIDVPRVMHVKLMQSDRYVVAFEIEALQLPDDEELSFGPVVIRFLDEARRRLDTGDLEWLKHRGKVYAAVEAA